MRSFVFNHLLGYRVCRDSYILFIPKWLSVSGPWGTLLLGNRERWPGVGAVICFQLLVGFPGSSCWVYPTHSKGDIC